MVVIAFIPAARRRPPDRANGCGCVTPCAMHALQAVLLSLRLVVILTLLAVPIAKLLPAVADEFGNEAHNLGVLTAFYSLGGGLVRGGPASGHEAPLKVRAGLTHEVLACGVSLVIIGIVGGELGGTGRQVAVLALLVPIGMGLAMAQAVLSATVQVSASAEMEGQVIALYATVVSLVTPIGGFALAGVADATSVWLAVAIAGAGLAVVTVAMRLVKAARADDRRHARNP